MALWMGSNPRHAPGYRRLMECVGGISNVYASSDYASAYANLGWTGTYYLIRRELPGILHKHAPEGTALDFGCGTGRSTRLLRELNYQVVGVDVSDAMVERARVLDPGQDYRVIADGDLSNIKPESFDLVLACFPFDNIAGRGRKVKLFSGLARLLRSGGRLVNIVSSADIYVHEWVSFTTAPFEQNRSAKPGDAVQIITTEFSESQVCDDVLCDDDSYREMYHASGLNVVDSYRPLGLPNDPVAWVSELRVAPWVIWVLRSSR
jgi:SAM-dependent methyltransferase